MSESKRKKFSLKEFAGKHKKGLIMSAVVIIAAVSVIFEVSGGKKKEEASAGFSTAKAEKGDLKVEITGSGTIEANEQYDITSLVNGKVVSDYFEEGDMLEEGAVMYEIDSENAKSSISRSQSSLERAKDSYNTASEDYSKLTVKAPVSGTVISSDVKKGSTVNAGSKLFVIENNSKMLLKIYFNASDAPYLYQGATGTVYLDNSSTQLRGTVERVSTGSFTSNGVSVCQADISVNNPGGIKEGETATAIINNVACNRAGKFEVYETRTVTADVGGDVSSLNVGVGDKVSAGQTMAVLKSSSAERSLKDAQLSYSDAQTSLNDAYDTLEDYTITAPITGTVLSKTVKAGDKISMGSSGTTTMAIIADMSKLKFTISVDELDISKMKEGLEVDVTCDALEDKTFKGYIDNVSVVGTTSNGVTTYPITVVLEEYGDLIPGMNVDATIVVEEVKDVLKVPLSAVQRGNIVYVKNEDLKEGQAAENTQKDTAEKTNGKKDDKKTDPFEGFTAVKVETGLSSSDAVEIVSGIYEGQEVYVVEATASQSSMERMMQGMSDGGHPGGDGGGPQGGGPGGGGGPQGGM